MPDADRTSMKGNGADPRSASLAFETTVDSRRVGAAPVSATLRPGRVLDGKYALGSPIGEGAMGTVYEGRHVLLDRRVAIKVMKAADRASEVSAQEHVLREGRNLASIVHPHVVEIFDLGLTDGLYYLVMAYLEGETLQQRLARRGPLDPEAVCLLGRQLLGGLAAAHAKGVVHRDLKPANVFLVSAGDDALHAKILDFGVSTTLASAAAALIAGTPSYMAPEQLNGEPIDARADLYGLGATLYQALTGQRPFDGRTLNQLVHNVLFEPPTPPSQIRAGIGAAIDAPLLRALSKKRTDRFSSAIEMLEALRAAAPPSSAGRARREYVLIAEPNPAAAARCRAIVEELGRTAVLARDGAEALELTESMGPPSLVIANLSLPRIDGFSLLKRLRERVPVPVPAVVASPFPALRGAAAARQEALGITSVLDDFSADALRAAVLRGVPPPPRSAPAGAMDPDKERRRLSQIDAMGLVDDKPPPDALQHLVGEVARALDVSIALVSLVLEDRQWFKAHCGVTGTMLAERGTPRDWAFCHHVVEGGEALVVPDARNHPVFAENPLVTSGDVGGYIGAPVFSASGDVLGTLCVIDNKPLDYGQDAVDALCALARRVGDHLQRSAPADTIARLLDDEAASKPAPR